MGGKQSLGRGIECRMVRDPPEWTLSTEIAELEIRWRHICVGECSVMQEAELGIECRLAHNYAARGAAQSEPIKSLLDEG